MPKTKEHLSFIASAAICLTVFSPRHLSSQVPAAPILRFEVATIKPSRSDNTNSNLNFRRDGITTDNISLLFLLKRAYGLNAGSDDQIVGAPAWIRDTAFDINAKEDDATIAALQKMSNDERESAMDSMLRTLLEERFKLKVHTDYQPRTVAALVLAKGGSKLIPSTTCDSPGSSQPCQTSDWQGLHNDGHGHIEGKDTTIATLADVLARQPDIGGRMVVDKTGLADKYSFDLHYVPGNTPAEDTGPSLFSALQEQLGLKLQAEKLPIKVLVIDQVEHPSPN